MAPAIAALGGGPRATRPSGPGPGHRPGTEFRAPPTFGPTAWRGQPGASGRGQLHVESAGRSEVPGRRLESRAAVAHRPDLRFLNLSRRVETGLDLRNGSRPRRQHLSDRPD